MSTSSNNNYVQQIVKYVQQKFPDVELLDVVDTPDSRDSRTILVKAPDDDDIQFDIMETASEIAMDSLLESEQHFLVMPLRNLDDAGILK